MNIADFVKKAGKVSFHDFMEHALYCPEDGYYGSGKVRIGGEKMDFVTHPTLASPFFGQGLVRQLYKMWLKLRRPSEFDLVEIGGGFGILARDILSESKRLYPNFYNAIKYLMVEISPALVEKQKESLKNFQGKADYFQGSVLDFKRKIMGVVLSNELIDSMPIHRIVHKDGDFKEVYVSHKGGEFVEELDELSLDQILSYIGNIGMEFLENQQLCVNLKGLLFLERISQNLEKGFIITFDYGDSVEALYGEDLSHIRVGKERFVGTHPYTHASSADITSDVDFSGLIKAGQELGLKKTFYGSEFDFFKKWLADEADAAEGLFEKIIGSNHKVLIQEKV